MKKLISILALGAIFIGCDGAITSPTSNDLMKPTYNYEIDTWGSNSEIYEFTPKSNKSMTCVMLMLDSGQAMGLQCFKKGK